MAAPNSGNVAASKPGVGGGVYVAPRGTALPTDATTALANDYKALGYLSESGITPTRETNVEKIKAWGGDIVAMLLADESRSFEFTLIEVFSEEVQKFVHGSSNVTVTPAGGGSGTTIDVQDKGGKPDQCVLVFEMLHAGKKRRVVVPVADPTVTGEEPYVDTGLSAYTVTAEALKDSSGIRVYEYLVNDDASA